MARIPESELERLKEEVSVEQFVRAHGIELAKSGKDWRGKCPFHEDSTPSFVVTPAKNLWHCFGCNAGGGPVDWVMKANGISFRHAVELLREGTSTPARSLSVSPQLAALGGGKPSRTTSSLGKDRSRAALPDRTRAQRMTLAQLFEQEDREARAQTTFKQPLAEIGEEESEEEDDEAKSSEVLPGSSAHVEPLHPNVSKQDHIPLAGYLLGRAVDGRPVPENEVTRRPPSVRAKSRTKTRATDHGNRGTKRRRRCGPIAQGCTLAAIRSPASQPVPNGK